MKFSDSILLAFTEIKSARLSYFYAVLIVSLSIAAVIVSLSVARGLLQFLPFPDGDEVLRVRVTDAEGGEASLSREDFSFWKHNLGSIAEFGAFSNSSMLVDLKGELTDSRISFVTENASAILKMNPIIGRWPSENEQGVVVIAHHLWETIYESSPDVLNSHIGIEGETWAIVGVMPDGFRFPFMEDMWKIVDPNSERLFFPEVFCRLNAQVDFLPAKRDLELALNSMPNTDSLRKIQLLGFTEDRGGAGEAQLLVAILVVSLAMTIVACTSVSNILSERAMGKVPALALHKAVGATNYNILIQLATESAFIGMVSIIFGVSLAYFGAYFLTMNFERYLGYFWTTFDIDPMACIVVSITGLLLTIISSQIPLRKLFRSEITFSLGSNLGTVKGKPKSLLSWIVINGQLSLSCIAVAVAFLFANSAFVRQPYDRELAEHLWVAPVTFEQISDSNVDNRLTEIRTIIDTLNSNVNVISAAIVSGNFLLADRVSVATLDRQSTSNISASISYISSDFFDVLGLEVDASDQGILASAEVGASASQSLVDYLPGNSIRTGEILRLEHENREATYARLSGVVSNLQLIRRDNASPTPRIYLPLEQSQDLEYTLIVRADNAELLNFTTMGISPNEFDPVIGKFTRLDEQLNYYSEIFENLGLIVILGAAASLTILIIGLCALISLDLELRKKEFAIHKALGASEFAIWMRITKHAMGLTAPGILAGMALSIFAANVTGASASQGGFLALIFVIYTLTIALAIGPAGFKQMKAEPAQILSEV